MDEWKRLIWNALMDAEMNIRYWDCMARKYSAVERYWKIGLAILSSGAAASLFLVAPPIVSKIVAILVAAGNTTLLFHDYRTRVDKMTKLKQTWMEFQVDYQRLWIKAEKQTFEECDHQAFDELRKEEAGRTTDEATLPQDPELIRKCQAEALKARGLQPKGLTFGKA